MPELQGMMMRQLVPQAVEAARNELHKKGVELKI
jgi:hypothetical protein